MGNITFRSRYGDLRTLIEDKPGEYTFSGFNKIQYMRVGENPNGEGFEFIDADGGPFLSVGGKLTEDLMISKIIFEDGRYKIITKKIQADNNEEPQDRTGDSEGASDG